MANIGLKKLYIEGGETDLLAHDAASLQAIDVVFAELRARIVTGCSEMFVAFLHDRIVVKDDGEKYLFIKRQHL
ncbi:hypothetical protein H9Q16_04370 [Sulfitobacter sp. TSTF-M16]|uniref:Uncharacterized protein n=1 Tax=Sulfitobacter aestuariivivens TaxID=2766981 RepID=A0A927D2J0_9RHOB|nr:hypothetical protein [Sulfitobacter aestuariivivens]MBD3663148.1 hypothetical protein [Sulfitobacter aestuariivivens]